MISEDIINQIWEKAPIVNGLSEEVYRLDPCGALIKRDKLNDRTNDYGWEIDHVFPKALLLEKQVPEELIDDIINLRPMHWKNNDSKGFDYPEYRSCVTFVKSVVDETAKEEGAVDKSAKEEGTVDETAKEEGAVDETAKEEGAVDKKAKENDYIKKFGANIETDDIYEVYDELQKELKNKYSKYFDHDLKFQFFD